MELKDKLPKQVYDDLLVMLGKSYLPSNDQGEDDQQNSDLRKSFREHILPRIVAKIDEIAKNLRITFAIAEGKTTEEITGYQANIETIKDFLKDKKPLHKMIDDMAQQIEKAKQLL